MESYKDELKEIKRILSENPKGLTISEISEKININRNSVAKYLDVLRISGNLEKKNAGPAKIFYLTKRLPLSSYLEISSEGLVFLNENLKVIMVNDFFSKLVKIKKNLLIEKCIDEEPFKTFFNEVQEEINKCLNGKECIKEIKVLYNEEKMYFNVKIIPTTFEDGKLGITLVIDDITTRRKAEKDLKKSERLLRKAEEIAHVGSWELDVEKNVLIWSDELYKIFGFKPREFELNYEKFLKIIHPDDRKLVDEAYSSSIKEGKDNYEVYHRILKGPNGEIRYIHEKCEHIKDESGKVIKSLGMAQDITEQKKNEEKIEHLASFPELNPNPVMEIDKNGDIIYCNKTTLKILNDSGFVDPRILLPKDIFDILKISFDEESKNFYREVKLEGKTFGEYIYVTKKYNVARIYAIDITKMTTALEELKNAYETLRLSQSASNSGVWDWNIEDNILSWTDEFYELMGIKRENVKESYEVWLELVHPEDREKADKNVKDSIADKKTLYNEYRIIKPNNEIKWIYSIGKTFYNKDKPIRMVGICLDVTEQKKNEELFKSIYKNSPIALELYDSKGKLIDANQATLNIYGVKDIKDVAHYNLFDEPNLSEKHKKMLQEGSQITFYMDYDFDKIKKLNYYKTSKSGKIFIEVTMTKLKGNGPDSAKYLVQVQEMTN